MSDLENHLKQSLQDKDFKTEWERIQPEYNIMKAIIKARLDQNVTQEELAQRTGIRQSNISRIESGVSSPTVDTLIRIADGLGKKLIIEFK